MNKSTLMLLGLGVVGIVVVAKSQTKIDYGPPPPTLEPMTPAQKTLLDKVALNFRWLSRKNPTPMPTQAEVDKVVRETVDALQQLRASNPGPNLSNFIESSFDGLKAMVS